MMQTYRLILLMGALGVALATSACDPTTPSEVTATKMQVKDQVITETLSAGHADLTRVPTIAQNILRNGSNVDVTLTVPYISGGYTGAARLGSAYKKAFVKEGVTNFSVALVEMTDSKDTGKAVLSWQGLVASQPDDCGRMPGAGNEGTGNLEDAQGYHYGCETQANIGKMIADPSDLLGKAPNAQADSRRNGTIIEPYEAGKPNQKIGGMSASTGQ